jgi:phosphoribosylglycinamide formyltransferase 1
MPHHRVLLCTSGDTRHKFIASKLSEADIDLSVIQEQNTVQLTGHHFKMRSRFEQEFFEDQISAEYMSHCEPYREINPEKVRKLIEIFAPDTFVSFGCSIINPAALSRFICKRVNIHLGLSPCYRGTATNFWPIHNHEIQYCGVTFHELTTKIDEGSIFYQFTADRKLFETVHHLVNSIIKKIPYELIKVLNGGGVAMDQTNDHFSKKPCYYFKKSDFTIEKANELLSNFKGIVEKFLDNLSSIKIKTLV